MTISVLDAHMNDYDRHMTLAHVAMNDGDFDEAWKQFRMAEEASYEIIVEAATIEEDLESFAVELDVAENEAEEDEL